MDAVILNARRGIQNAICFDDQRGDTASSVENSLAKSINRYFYFAFRRSLRDCESYEKAAAMVDYGDRRSFLLEMAQRKKTEAENLYYCYQANGKLDIQSLVKRDIISTPHYRRDLVSQDLLSIEDVYSLALSREQDTFDLYCKLGNLDTNPRTKKQFAYLSRLQREHLAFIQSKSAL